MRPEAVQTALDRILPTVQKPGRYTGGEYNQIVKDWSVTPFRVALAFPDIYDIGMSNLGLAILYNILNRQSEVLAERVFAPWPDMEEAMRQGGVPLYSLETKHPLSDFDLIGFSLPYETLYTNTLNMLDLAELPIRSAERKDNHPIIIAGGHATHNPEPMADFIDAFVIGEGEEVILEIVSLIQHWKVEADSRDSLLRSLAGIQGVYVPTLYDVHYNHDGTICGIEPNFEGASFPVVKRIATELPPPLTRFIVPYLDITHNRAPIEIMRGCTRGCRFCQAGMITRPVRERRVDEIVDAIEQAVNETGFEEVGLLSLSSSDYSEILDLVNQVKQRFEGRHLNISLPSLRIETFSVQLMDVLQGDAHRGGFTLAPEAATERMREIINKPVSNEQFLMTVREIFKRGWHTIKLYFMIGHPSERMEDVQAIADLCKAVLAEGRAILGKRAKVHVGVSTFVPKPHTPFQWVPCDRIEDIEAKQGLLRKTIYGKGFKLNWNEPRETMLEAWLSRGDRRLGPVIEAAWRSGAQFDAWQEHHQHQAWMEAFTAGDLDPQFYTHRERELEEILPWDHISTAVEKSYLQEDYHWSSTGKTRLDCREHCYACGILPEFNELRRQYPGNGWKCPDVRSARKSEAEPVNE